MLPFGFYIVQLLWCVEIERKVEEVKVNPSGFFIQNKFKVNKKFMTENQLNFLPFLCLMNWTKSKSSESIRTVENTKLKIYILWQQMDARNRSTRTPGKKRIVRSIDFNMAWTEHEGCCWFWRTPNWNSSSEIIVYNKTLDKLFSLKYWLMVHEQFRSID